MCSVEEIDTMIMPTIRRIGCDFDANRLKDFNQENIFEAISRCLLQIYPDFPYRSCYLPQKMGDRFRRGTIIAEKIKELGFRDDIGYQSILYGNDIEIRRILIFLIERLPKEVAKPVEKIQSPRELLEKSIAQALKARLAVPVWVPWFCKKYKYEWDGRFWYRPDQTSVHFNAQPIQLNDNSTLVEQTNSRTGCFSSIVENNARLRYSIDSDTFVVLPNKPAVPVKPTLLVRTKPKLPPKPAISKIESHTLLTEEKVHESQILYNTELSVESQAPKIVQSNAIIDEMNIAIDSLGRSLILTEQEIIETTRAAKDYEIRLKTMESEISARKRIVDLLPNIDINIQKLQDYLDKSEVRSSNLMSQWEQHRRQMEDELNALRNERSTEHEKLQEDISNISDKIDAYDREYVEKEMLLGRLKIEAENNASKPTQAAGRNFYTKRILEIIANVRKQKDEIDRILDDVKTTQKDINMLSGKLDRTYKATDELMFEDAKRDELIRRAYRIFVSLHETCSQTSSDVEMTGQISREIRDLEDKIELEMQNGVDKKLEMLITNLCEIREENSRLTADLEKRRSAASLH